jgi:hypothetical protein
MKKIIIKKIWFAVFALFLVGSSLEVSAQTTDVNAPNANHLIATDYDVTAYAYGTFNVENSLATLSVEMDNIRSSASSDTKAYHYYWLVTVDSKRNNISLENALLSNLKKVDQEYNMTNSDLQGLYNNTVNMLQ